MKIGYIVDAYPEKRCIIDKTGVYKFCNVKLSKTKIIKKIKSVLLRKKKVDWNKLVYDPFIKPKVDLLHTFNYVCDTGNVPWVVTFESTIPRTNQTVNRPWERDGNLYNLDRFTSKSLELLADDSCKKCIAISKSAFNIQMNMLEHFDISSEVKENLIRKTVVVHPPQEIFCSEEEIKQKYQNINCCIEILFVGRLFFRKGGEMIVKALENMLSVK